MRIYTISGRLHLTVFYVAVFFSFFAWNIFYLTISEWLIVGITIFNLIFRPSCLRDIKRNELIIFFLWFLYVIGAIVTFYYNNTYLTYGQQFLLPMFHSGILPFALSFCTFTMIRNYDEVESIIKCCIISILFFFLLIYLGFLFDYARPIDDIRVLEGDQITVDLKLGGIEFVTYATWLGAMTALAFPGLVFFFIKSAGKRKLPWFFFILLDLLFFSRALTRGGGLGIVVGMLVGMVLIIVFAKEFTRQILFVILLVAVVSVVGLYTLSDMLPEGGKRAYQSFYEQGLEVPNILFRFALFSSAYEYALSNIIGMGFNTLWVYYLIDEVNFYSWSANGTGLLGIVAIWSLFIILALRFIHIVRKHQINKRIYGILGMTTLCTIAVAAFGNDQILHRPQSVIPFWTIMYVCLKSADIKSHGE